MLVTKRLVGVTPEVNLRNLLHPGHEAHRDPPSVAYPGFPWGMGANPPGAPTYEFCQISPKTA